MLGPGVNILRTPLCGRNFEYLGEDPFLSGTMASGYIRGEQSQDISACVKHFALNNQEFERESINVEVDERSLREIYLPAFKAAVQEGGVWAVMGAYNQLRGQHCCENDYLLNKILKGEWGFKGLVMSDWAGVHDTREAALNGLDLEMGTDNRHRMCAPAQAAIDGHAVRDAYLYKEISEALHISVPTVNTHIRRIYEKLHVRSRSQAIAKFTHIPNASVEP